jgi:AGZA family xanthine/uracil permease-like MFS transporter
MNKERWADFVAGVSIFLSMSYVAFANPALMVDASKDGHGMSAIGVFVATCLIAAISTFFSGYFSKSPTALAPGLALSIVIGKYLKSTETAITWESALIVCGAAGFTLLMISLGVSSSRRAMINAIPPIIKKAIMAGIGSVLAKAAIDFVQYYPFSNAQECANNPKLCNPQQGYGMIFFSVGLAIILFGYFGLRGKALTAKAGFADALDVLGRVSFVASIVVVALLVNELHPAAITVVSSATGSLWPWSDSVLSFGQAVQGAVRLESIGLFIIILYILIVDIVGSPYHLASVEQNTYDSVVFSDDEELRIKRSFYVDSGANILAPLIGSTPVVYYAENFAGKVLGGRGSLVAYVVASGFVVLLLIGLGFRAHGGALTSFIPQIAVAPVLFIVGLIIMSEALREDKKAPVPNGSQNNKPDAAGRSDLVELVPRIPAPLAIVVTPLAGFETGIAAGIIFYVMFVPWFGAEQIDSQDGSRKGWLTALTIVAVFSVFIKAKLYFGF